MDEDLMQSRKKVIYDFICDETYIPMKVKEIANILQISKEDRVALKEILTVLMEEGKIEITSKGKYIKTDDKYLTGIFEGTARGFGFVCVEGETEDIFVPEDAANGALHKDTVQVAILTQKSGKRREGIIVKILARGKKEVVGTFQKSKNFGFVLADNARFHKDIFIPLERSKGAVNGHKVVAEITNYGDKNKNPEGKIIEIIGHMNDPGTDIMSIVRGYDLPCEFPEKVLNQAEKTPDAILGADMQGRMDLRSWQTVTIDGEDAKDLDDAITISKQDDCFRLGVHIADVTNYVQEKSAMDVEALNRGTSVYLVDRVIPMLPHKLSNGICSLNEGEDRLALSCMMTIDGKGNVTDHKIAETVVNIDRRMTYTSVKKILEEQDLEERKEYAEFVPMFEQMEQLACILRKKRRARGSIDFDFPETKIILDDKGHPIEIKPYDRNIATKIIEDFMLIANETVAQDFFWQEIPFAYRTHDNPDPEKIQKLGMFINNFGYAIKLSQDELHPKELQKLLGKIEGTPEEMLISRLTLRSMKQARYTTMNTGHFGLATKFYCHFTSPIRRYPDLQIHRIIKETLRGKMVDKRIVHYEKILGDVTMHSSLTERRADEAERETNKLKKVEYMEKYIGEIFDGVISGMMSRGIYVELPNTVEGMISVTTLKDDMYHYDDTIYEMIGEVTNRRWKLGQKIKVKVTGTDKVLRTIDFEMVEDQEVEESAEGKC